MKRWKHKQNHPATPETPETPPVDDPAAGDPAIETPPADGAPPPAGETVPPAEETVPLERLQRLQADFDNYRKRMIRERSDIVDRATENLMLELLPALDNFEIALQHAAGQPAHAAVVEGFRLVADQIETALRKFNLEPVPAEGLPFDPHQHEAVAHLPSPDHPEGMIMQQTRRGFWLGDKLLRAAQVVVSSGPPPATTDPATDAAQEE